jgi:hypothetical protein
MVDAHLADSGNLRDNFLPVDSESPSVSEGRSVGPCRPIHGNLAQLLGHPIADRVFVGDWFIAGVLDTADHYPGARRLPRGRQSPDRCYEVEGPADHAQAEEYPVQEHRGRMTAAE